MKYCEFYIDDGFLSEPGSCSLQPYPNFCHGKPGTIIKHDFGDEKLSCYLEKKNPNKFKKFKERIFKKS
jgi:hypothetical protein